jgi:hypothetical protein
MRQPRAVVRSHPYSPNGADGECWCHLPADNRHHTDPATDSRDAAILGEGGEAE